MYKLLFIITPLKDYLTVKKITVNQTTNVNGNVVNLLDMSNKILGQIIAYDRTTNLIHIAIPYIDLSSILNVHVITYQNSSTAVANTSLEFTIYYIEIS